ncbi:4Fe-4S ferredoxin [Paenibacillus riograndensis]|uniref:4Fe-4S ferredoxin n=1 Tax=Paenibacillus riograndensis TaxID=483937 RepID=A0A132TY84_9BACL|nr:4Fe-4S binding protein [Paenibacillus riograndensis]KWX76204.1 4Fe-4S ferredoxin [Paenibacillus riograndensis]
MRKQTLRKTLLLLSMLLFPVTLNYFSPYLIIQGSFAGIATGSCLLFAALFGSSLWFGRAFCSWVCPAGGLQDTCSQVVNKPAGSRQNLIKYLIWLPWVLSILAGFVTAGGIKDVNPIYFTDHGISVSAPPAFITYFAVVLLIVSVSLIFGRRSFCHSLCWMAPFMVLGNSLKNKLGYPSLHLEARTEDCISCKKCDRACPMSLKVNEMVQNRDMNSNECILCGSCEAVCPKQVLRVGFGAQKHSAAKSSYTEGA